MNETHHNRLMKTVYQKTIPDLKNQIQNQCLWYPCLFGHGKIYKLENGVKLVGCYHPSPRNVNTGRINEKKMTNLFKKVKKLN